MRYCLDLDNTICITPKNEYEKSTIIEKAKNLINKLLIDDLCFSSLNLKVYFF
jgi:hypothetical protein